MPTQDINGYTVAINVYGSQPNAANRSRGRPAIPLDRILATALDLVDEQGADALTMRSLAQRLESGTATLYRHFADRSELVSMVVDHLIGEADLDVPTIANMPWQQVCMSFAQQMFEALSRHRNVATLLIDYTPVGPNALANRERCLSVLLGNGFAPAAAAHAYATLARYVLGFGLQLSGSAGVAHDAELAAAFRGLDASRYPATAAVADELPVPLGVEFAFGLRLIVTGLERLHA